MGAFSLIVVINLLNRCQMRKSFNSMDKKSKKREKRLKLVKDVKKRKVQLAKEYGNLRRPSLSALDIATQLRIISINANNQFRAAIDSNEELSEDCLFSMLDYLTCSISALLPLINRLPVFDVVTNDPPIDKAVLQEGLDDIAFILPSDPTWDSNDL